jgi:hypothetical protein
MPITDLARWNTTTGTWSQLGSGIDSAGVFAIAVDGNEVYVGYYGSPGGRLVAPHVAKWNSATNIWSPLGAGMNNAVQAIDIGVDGVYVGGNFTTAGGKPSNHIGLWHAAMTTPPRGSISGRVTGSNSSPVAGARVQVCPSAGGACLWRGTTDAQGNYASTGLIDGQYLVTVYPPASSARLPGRVGPLTITNGAGLTGQNIHMANVQPLPAGTLISPSRTGGAGLSRVNWNQPVQLSTQGCAGGSASYQITQLSATLRSGAMTESPAGQYHAAFAALAPNVGYARGRITLQCPSGVALAADTIIDFDLYIEPAGTVRTVQGAPLAGATVTLYYYDSTTGSFNAVPDGDAIMAPVNRANPDTTDVEGNFGWDVVDGFYKIRAERAGCVSPDDPVQPYLETDVLVIPPPTVTDLDLHLDCAANAIYLPLIVMEY